jgi:intracellular proteinase inhibitor BsuPI
MPIDKGFDTNFATPKTFGLFSVLMKRRIILFLLIAFTAGNMCGQDLAPTATPARRRGWLSRILHPFSPEVVPQYKDPRLRGLALDLQINPQTVKLSEVRQLGVKVTLANLSKRPIALDFPTNQRIEIYLMDSGGDILAKWSDNHAITEKPATILINSQERVEYSETIATRELTPNKVFIAEVFFPQYPELRIRQKFLAVP